MKYITSVSFPSNDTLIDYMNGHSFDDWPFKVFLDKDLNSLLMNDITILYGNNGSGKSTILNCICERIGASRNKPIFKDKKWNPQAGSYYPLLDYLEYVGISYGSDPETGFEMTLPNNLRLITSDDIFTKINNTIRSNNISVQETDAAHDEYFQNLREHYQLSGLDDFEEFHKRYEMKRKSAAQYIRENSRRKLEMHSNGETAISYFEDMFEPDGLYFLDEPENCLSPVFHIELIKIIVNAKRFLNCQFIIATHSPLILSIPDALVYDLDDVPVTSKNWYELENVKVYFNFFDKNKDKFKK